MVQEFFQRNEICVTAVDNMDLRFNWRNLRKEKFI